MSAKLVVLISGNGSNLQSIIDACNEGVLPASVVAVVSNNAEAYGLLRAEKAGIKTIIAPKAASEARSAYDGRLAELIEGLHCDFIILVGWMRLLSSVFLQKFPGMVINLHPALPGTFPGIHAISRAYDAFLQGTIDQTGVMVHLVPDEGVDTGPVLASKVVNFQKGETLDEFEKRMHDLEHLLLVETLGKVISGKIKISPY